MDIKALVAFWFVVYTAVAEIGVEKVVVQPPSCTNCGRVRPSHTAGRGDFWPEFNQYWKWGEVEPSFGIIRKVLPTKRPMFTVCREKNHHPRKKNPKKISGRGRFRPGFNSDYWESLLAEPHFST